MTFSERTLRAAQGYFELGMTRDALRELDALPPADQLQPEALEMRILVLMKLGRWRKAVRACESLCAVEPASSIGYIQMGFCLHRLGRTRKAREVLVNGPQSLQGEAIFHYNLACYECVLGNVETAKVYLEKSLAMDDKLRHFAREDPDLEPLYTA